MTVSKYTKCEDLHFENFPHCLRDNNGNRSLMKPVGMFETIYYCHVAAERKHNEADGREYFVFGIVFIDDYLYHYESMEMRNTKIEVRYKCFMKNHIEADVKCEEVKEILSLQWEENNNYKYTENKYDMEEILDEQNGFLKNGKLTIRVEISVDAIISSIGIRQWGFPNFEPAQKQWAAIILSMKWLYGIKQRLYVNRQIIEFHAPSLPKNKIDCLYAIYQVLQIMHGVRPSDDHFPYFDLIIAIRVASDYKVHNAIRICEQHTISEYRLGCRGHLDDALKYNLRSYLKVLLEKVKSPKRLKKKLEKVEWEGSSAEIMKHLVAKFFSFA